MKKILLFSLILTGCLSEKKLAETCSEKFPIREQIKEILIIDTLVNTDTVKIKYKGDSIVLPCPPSKTITLTKELIKTQENTAKIEYMRINHQQEMETLHRDYQNHEEAHSKEIDKLKKELNNVESKYQNVKKFKLWFWLLVSGLGLIFAIRNSWLKFPL